jgi:Toprim-like/CHC2 zinc finger
MRADQARQISIPLFLERAGHKPAKSHKGGRELWYTSPLRDERTPSFKVDTVLNLWFDHGLDRGGNIIDLVVEMRRVTVKEALAILGSGYTGSTPSARPLPENDGAPAGEKEKDWSFEVLGLTVPEHPALLKYFAARCIDTGIGKQHLFEVRFRRAGALKTYFGLGFPSGAGFDVRNSLFKGFVGKGKNFSKLNFTDRGTVAVFEGAFDYLTWLTMRGLTEPDCAVIVLHSIVFKRAALDAITEQGFGRVLLFLDHDAGGRACTRYFEQELGNRNVVDRSSEYAGYKDLNEWWVAQDRSKSST